jgi:hypothetical protein
MLKKLWVLVGTTIFGTSLLIAGEIPQMMHYSADLSTTDVVNIDFYITSTTVHSDSAYLWHESTSAAGGRIDYNLGSNNPIPRWIFTGDMTIRFLEVRIDAQSTFSQLVSVPYSYRSSYTTELAGGTTVQGGLKVLGLLSVGGNIPTSKCSILGTGVNYTLFVSTDQNGEISNFKILNDGTINIRGSIYNDNGLTINYLPSDSNICLAPRSCIGVRFNGANNIFIGGGSDHHAIDNFATICGGYYNEAGYCAWTAPAEIGPATNYFLTFQFA